MSKERSKRYQIFRMITSLKFIKSLVTVRSETTNN